MTKEELINNAKCIMFPYNNEYYAEWLLKYPLVNNSLKMPIISKQPNIQYDNMPGNNHHYTTYYHRTYVMPLLGQLLNFKFDLSDFTLIKKFDKNNCDISYLIPKNNYSFFVKSLNNNTEKEYTYDELMPIDEKPDACYRFFYKYFHQCSIIKNLNINNDRKLFISCDSQMIPSILMLACYFEEVWMFDNRTGHIWNDKEKKLENYIDYKKLKHFSNEYKNVSFTDVLIEFYTNPYDWYTDINLM